MFGIVNVDMERKIGIKIAFFTWTVSIGDPAFARTPGIWATKVAPTLLIYGDKPLHYE